MKHSLMFCSLVLILLSNCEKKEPYTPPTSTHTLVKVDEYEIEIDSVTAGNYMHYQLIKEDGREYLTFLNRVNQVINAYDLETKRLAFKIPLLYNGPNSVGSLKGFNSGYHIHTLDSIFVLNRRAQSLSLLNRQSQIIAKHDLSRAQRAPSAVLAPFAPMHVEAKQAFLLNIQGAISHFKRNRSYNAHFATVLDLERSIPNYFLSYPEKFTDGAWGIDMHRITWVYNENRGSFLVSYTIDDAIYEVNLKGQVIAKHDPQSRMIQTLRSIKKSEKAALARRNYYLLQDKYGQLFYDPHRKIYLRDHYQALSEQDIIDQTAKSYNRNWIILDKNFKQIGMVPETSFDLGKIFFTKQGIHKYIETDNEDALKFEVYELKKL